MNNDNSTGGTHPSQKDIWPFHESSEKAYDKRYTHTNINYVFNHRFLNLLHPPSNFLLIIFFSFFVYYSH